MLYTLYIVERDFCYRVCYSPVIGFDILYWESRGYQLIVLATGISIGVAYTLQREVCRRLEKSVLGRLREILFGKQSPAARGAEICGKLLENLGVEQDCRDVSGKEGLGFNPAPEEITAVLSRLKGRVLLWPEVIKAIDESGYEIPANLDVIVQKLYLDKKVNMVPGVGYFAPGKLKCFRCGSESKIFEVNCGRCNNRCFYCEECILLGTSRFCEPIIIGGAGRTQDVNYTQDENCTQDENYTQDDDCTQDERYAQKEMSQAEEGYCVPKLSFGSMTAAQESASDELRCFVNDPNTEIALVWAVCGAGKTEVVFGAIATALNKGFRVLYAAPRRDVVAELYPRFKEAFPDKTLTALYGGSDSKYEEAAITLATTHQAVRFSLCFDLLVVDEVDAFPYRGSSFLPGILQRARGPGAKTIYMTATPNAGILREVRINRGPIVTVPARHHGHKLPVPEVLICEPMIKGKLDSRIQLWLNEQGIKRAVPVFIFVPSIKLGHEITTALRHLFGIDRVEFVNAGDCERDQKREDFRARTFPFLVTTTIMERGITVPEAQVIVLWADQDRVFGKETLIQIAGRAGRTTQYPDGKVLFAGVRLTGALEGAIKEIEYFNVLAGKRGLVHETMG